MSSSKSWRRLTGNRLRCRAATRPEHRLARAALLALGNLALVGFGHAQTWHNQPISFVRAGDAANLGSGTPRLSRNDGRYLAYNSGATNLLVGMQDSGAYTSVLIHDRVSGTSRLISHAAGNPLVSAEPADSRVGAISADGAWVLYSSTAPNLVIGQTEAGFVNDVYLYDTALDSSRLLTHVAGGVGPANGESLPRALTADGRWAVYATRATNVQSGVVDRNNQSDLYLYDALSNGSTLITHAAGLALTTGDRGVDSLSGAVHISDDGRWVAFAGPATNHVAGQVDNNDVEDIFLFDALSGSMVLISHVSSSASQTPGESSQLTGLSADGRYALFNTVAANLIAGTNDNNNATDAFLYDRSTGSLRLMSHVEGATFQAANAASLGKAISRDGQHVLLETTAGNLASGIVGPLSRDVFVRNVGNGTARLISHANGTPTTRANAASQAVAVSSQGQFALFESVATNVIGGFFSGTANASNVYCYDSQTQSSQLVTHVNGLDAFGADMATQLSEIQMTGDAAWIALGASAAYLAATVDGNGTQDIYLHERSSNTASLVTRAAFERTTGANGATRPVAITPNARYTLLNSSANNLTAMQSESGALDDDVFVHDGFPNTTTLISNDPLAGLGIPANDVSEGIAISDDGRFVLLRSRATNIAGFTLDNNNAYDVFLRDRQNNSTLLVSHSSAPSGIETGNGQSLPIGLSGDGRWVLFHTLATNLLSGYSDTNSHFDVYLYDRTTGSSQLVSRAVGQNATGNERSMAVGITPDGRYVLFESMATNLLSGFVNNNTSASDAFRFDRTTGSSILVSRAAGSTLASGNGLSQPIAISADGDVIAFYSAATNLVSGVSDANTAIDSFAFQASSGSTSLISHAVGMPNQTANSGTDVLGMSADGHIILLSSLASNLIGGLSDNNAAPDVYLHDRIVGGTVLFSRNAANATLASNRQWHVTAISPDGVRVLFNTLATDVLVGATGNGFFQQAYRYDRVLQRASLISHRLDNQAIEAQRSSAAIAQSALGERVVLYSESTNIVDWLDVNGAVDAFIAEEGDDVIFRNGFEESPVRPY